MNTENVGTGLEPRPSAGRLVVLISGRGSNLQAIQAAIQARELDADIVAVVSNRDDAFGLAWARQLGIPALSLDHRAYASREAFDAALAERIDGFCPDWVVLAGFMRILSAGFVDRYRGRLINIHPSLLPAFPGLKTHDQAIQAGVSIHGATVHFVTPALDHGPVILQGGVPVFPDDTPDALAGRLLKVEHVIYPLALQWLVSGLAWLDGDTLGFARDVVEKRFYFSVER